MKTRLTHALWLVVGLAVGALVPAHAELTHRYSFTTDASDSVGHANGTLEGDAFVSGALYLDGTSNSYVELPADLISNYTAVTFDFWISPQNNGNWCELYAFGDRNPNGQGRHMLMFTPHSGAGDFRMSYADGDPGNTHEFVVTQPGTLDYLGPIHITCVYDPATSFMGLYTNGVLAASRADLGSFYSLTNIWNVHSWLGQSLYVGDAWYNGSIDEFRIYNSALNPVQIAGSQIAGPDTVSDNPGIPTRLTLSVRSSLEVGGTAPVSATADYTDLSGVVLLGVPGIHVPAVTLTSSDTSVATVDTNGIVTAVGFGSATITLTYDGQTASQDVTVTGLQTAVLEHRYSFATDASDSVGTANGTLDGDATISNGVVNLDGTDGTYVDLPNDMLTNYDSLTMEVWVTDNGSQGWARIWDFGDSVGGEGQEGGGTRYLFLSLPSGNGNLRGSYTITGGGAGEQVLEWPGQRPPIGQETHIVWTTDGSFHIGKLYVNGFLVDVNTNMTLTPRIIGPTFNDWLGRSQFNDPPFNGTIDEFRIYKGALTPLQVAVDTAAGPNKLVSDPGTLQSLQLSLGTNAVIYGGLPVQAMLSGNYANQANVNLTTLEGATFQSSDPSVAAINAQGVVTATGLGTVTLTGAFGGMTNSIQVTTTTPPGYVTPTLIHRYSFNEPTGSTTVTDSIGTANGTIQGAGAVFDGKGQLSLPGGTASNADPTNIAAYVDLPNHIINVLTNASFEAWVTWDGSGSWQRIFDFGTSDQGEGISSGNGNYLLLTPAGPTDLHFTVRDTNGVEPAPLTASAPLQASNQVYLAVVYDYTANVAMLYSNAVLVASGHAPVALSTIDDVNNWLGRSQWPDPMFQGQYNEFRIWSGVLLPNEVAAHYAAGPDSLTPAPILGAVLSQGNVTLSWPTSVSGFVLQSSSQLGPNANWTTVTNAPVVTGGQNTVTLPVDQPAVFYRLKQ